MKHFLLISFVVLSLIAVANATPVIVNGALVSRLLNRPCVDLRVVDHQRRVIPFQVDEVTSQGEYVCPRGIDPNPEMGNGTLDSLDEIVFLWEDADTVAAKRLSGSDEQICIEIDGVKRFVTIIADAQIPRSKQCYIRYDSLTRRIETPWYYAVFGVDRFHFTNAGVWDFLGNKYIDLTSELRVEIYLSAMWGLLPIHYTEENIECITKRYKVGPIRMIRRGDFHLNLGMFIKGSRAAVTQFCYPQIVSVPVFVHLPVRLKMIFKEVYLEMTPVLREPARCFTFTIPQLGAAIALDGSVRDTFMVIDTASTFMRVDNGLVGYGWLLETNMPRQFLDGSGFIAKFPSQRVGIGHCGYRIMVTDMPAGVYSINNYVMFSRNPLTDFDALCQNISTGVKIINTGSGVGVQSRINALQQYKKRVQ